MTANVGDNDLAQLRSRQGGTVRRQFWRSLEELARADDFDEYLQDEFPEQASHWADSLTRRSFLKLMAASFTLAGVAGCGAQPAKEIVPYNSARRRKLSLASRFSMRTALTRGGFASGVLVESNMGRPTNIEGNPLHPASLGATDIFTQAAILSLYDPDRSRTVMETGSINTWRLAHFD